MPKATNLESVEDVSLRFRIARNATVFNFTHQPSNQVDPVLALPLAVTLGRLHVTCVSTVLRNCSFRVFLVGN